MVRQAAIALIFMPVAAAYADTPDVAVRSTGAGARHYAALAGIGTWDDDQTSIMYVASTGELWVDAPAGVDLTSINIQSVSGIFTGAPALNLGGPFDNDTDHNIFKATFGSSFGSLTFGNVAQLGLSAEFVMADLTVAGSLEGGGGLGNVDLAVPEPSSIVLALVGFGCLVAARCKQPF